MSAFIPLLAECSPSLSWPDAVALVAIAAFAAFMVWVLR